MILFKAETRPCASILRRTAPRNREGTIDYESPFCLDIDLLNRHFAMLERVSGRRR